MTDRTGDAPLLVCEGVSKSFGAVHALREQLEDHL